MEQELSIREGILHIYLKTLKGKVWKKVLLTLCDGTLTIKRNSAHVNHRWAKIVDIEYCTIDKAPEEGNKRAFVFGLRTPNAHLIFSASTVEDLDKWLEAFKQAIGKKGPSPTSPLLSTSPTTSTSSPSTSASSASPSSSSPPSSSPMNSSPTSPKETPRKQDFMFRAKKHISGKMVSSSLLKHQLLNDEVRQLLAALAKIVTVVQDEKMASDVEKQLVKMVLKGYFQIESQNITWEKDIRPIDNTLRQAFEQLGKLFAYYQVLPIPQLAPGLAKASALLKDVFQNALKVLEPHVRSENLERMHFALKALTEEGFLISIWENPSLEEDLFALVQAMTRYTMIAPED